VGASWLEQTDLTAAVSEGQSLEAIRQGLLTAHTFMSALDHRGDPLAATATASAGGGLGEGGGGGEGEEEEEEELLAKRTFYLGQWLDVKDTVNQWLEVRGGGCCIVSAVAACALDATTDNDNIIDQMMHDLLTFHSGNSDGH
jgi:hypothetical protein